MFVAFASHEILPRKELFSAKTEKEVRDYLLTKDESFDLEGYDLCYEAPTGSVYLLVEGAFEEF
jgi:hypothetical protein